MQQFIKSSENQFKTEDLVIGWSWRLFVFSLVVFATTALLYFGLSFGYEKYLTGKIDQVKHDIDELNKKRSAEEQKNLINFYSQVFHIRNLLVNHSLPSHLLTFMEQTAASRVYYETANFEQELGNLSLQGKAESYQDLVKQLESFRKRPEVKSLSIANSGVSAEVQNSGRISFTLKLNLSKDFLKP